MIPDEELWQVELEAADGSRFEVNSHCWSRRRADRPAAQSLSMRRAT